MKSVPGSNSVPGPTTVPGSNPVPGFKPLALYSRSRRIPTALAALACAALLTLGAASRPDAFLPYRGAPLLWLTPLLAAAAIGMSLHSYTRDLDETAVRPWWPRRLAHLLVLTAATTAALALAVPGDAQSLGAAGTVRNTLGAIGITAAGAVIFGARASWLPTALYFGAVQLSTTSPGMRSQTFLTWPLQPGSQPGAWTPALTLFVLGTALYATRGARPEGPRV
ncbi:hypothetical protein [Streptomyces sp. SD15]